MRPGGSLVKALIRQISRPFFWALDAIVSSAASVTSRRENGVRSSETELFSSRATSRILLIRPSRSSPLDWIVCKCSRWTSERPGDSLSTVAKPCSNQLELHHLEFRTHQNSRQRTPKFVTALRQELGFGSQGVSQLFGPLVHLSFQAPSKTLVHGDQRSECRQTRNDFSGSSRSSAGIIENHRR
jgi:hypothetical protein